MWSFIISVLILVAGYCFYGRFVEKVFGPDPSRQTPAIAKADGVDFVVMPSWRVFMIQFLNIAGTGPIFGAVMGAKFGPSSYLWIVLGSIFAGAVHDYLSGMISLRKGGASFPEVIGSQLGKGTERFVLAFTMVIMVLVGAVFVYSPAIILGGLAGDGSMQYTLLWCVVIFAYYVVATLVPVDKIIGKVYPLFAIALLFMAAGLSVVLFAKWPAIPEFWHGLGNRAGSVGVTGQAIFPCLFITIACGAISGFHATQSPLMARCLTNEKQGRPIFYGAMITEGIVALIWAAIGSYFFFAGGAAEVGGSIGDAAPTIVAEVSNNWLGAIGGILALLGVVAAPITSGDTAFRSARLILADFLHIEQKSKMKRVLVALPLFVVSLLLLWYNIADANGFNTIWRYFGWANQTLAVFTLWALTVYLTRNARGARFLITLIPACLMTCVCLTYICVDSTGLHLPASWTPWIATSVAAVSLTCFALWYRKER